MTASGCSQQTLQEAGSPGDSLHSRSIRWPHPRNKRGQSGSHPGVPSASHTRLYRQLERVGLGGEAPITPFSLKEKGKAPCVTSWATPPGAFYSCTGQETTTQLPHGGQRRLDRAGPILTPDPHLRRITRPGVALHVLVSTAVSTASATKRKSSSACVPQSPPHATHCVYCAGVSSHSPRR